MASLGGLQAFEADPAVVSLAAGHPPRRRVWATRFMPEQLYEHFARRTAASAACLPAGHPRIRDVPSEYVAVLPLEAVEGEAAGVTGSYGYVTSVFKGVSTEDGMAYTLRRVDHVRIPSSVTDAAMTAWAKARHPSVVALRRIIPTTPGGAGALFFLHDYHPGARSLKESLLDPGMRATTPVAAIPESSLWSYATQLIAGLRVVHEAGLSFRGISPAHVLLTDHDRVRITGAGVLDVLESDSKRPVTDQQAADMLSLGHLLLALAARGAPPGTSTAADAQLEHVRAAYSPLMHHLLLLLLSRPTTVAEVTAVIAPKLLGELDAAYDHIDAQDELLGRECDNGRLLRSLMKLGYINERPAYESDPSWSETGDRYLLKLYRDFLFHQVNDEGRAVIDVAHVVDSLNRLDRGTSDRILLSSRDSASILLASYAQLRKAVNNAFEDLHASQHGTRASGAASSGGGGGSLDDGIPYAARKAMGLTGGGGGSGGGSLPGKVRGRGAALAPSALMSNNAHTAAAAAAAAAAAVGGAGLLPTFSGGDASAAMSLASGGAAMMGSLLQSATGGWMGGFPGIATPSASDGLEGGASSEGYSDGGAAVDAAGGMVFDPASGMWYTAVAQAEGDGSGGSSGGVGSGYEYGATAGFGDDSGGADWGSGGVAGSGGEGDDGRGYTVAAGGGYDTTGATATGGSGSVGGGHLNRNAAEFQPSWR